MKKSSSVTVFFLACMALLWVSHGLASTDETKPLTSSKQPQVWPYIPFPPFPFPPYKFPPLPGHGGALPPLPPHKFPPPGDAVKCWSALHNIGGCVREIFSSFYSNNLSLSPQCCKGLTEVTRDCSVEVLGPFNNPLFLLALTEHCSSQAAPSPQP